jgi:hypothetical protein
MNTDKWTSQIDRTTEAFKREFSALTAEQLNRKPSPNIWSIAQNIDHLIVTNETYYPVVKALRDGSYKTPFTGKLGFMVNFFGNFILKSIGPDRKKKIKTFPIWEPSTSNIPADILARFEKHQAELKQLITGCSDLLDKGVVISSPASKAIVYKLEAAFDIIVAHEQRHFEQAKEVISR